MTAISYNDFNDIVLQLLKTNSPTKRITLLNEWLIHHQYNRSELDLIFQFLEFQRNEKAKQGSVGGKNKSKEDKDTIGTESLVEVFRELKEVIANNKIPQPTPQSKRKTTTGDHYKQPIWVNKCAGVSCDECGGEIDGCAFRWKRSGQYSSYHPTCIPPEHKAVFEGVKAYRAHFKLDKTVS